MNNTCVPAYGVQFTCRVLVGVCDGLTGCANLRTGSASLFLPTILLLLRIHEQSIDVTDDCVS